MSKEENCIFCKISRGEIKNTKIYKNDNFFSVYDINPKVNGHALIISNNHFENVFEMPQTLGQELIEAIKKTSEILMKKHKPSGFNIAVNVGKVAGQVVNHLHFHLLPRKEGDGFSLRI